MRSEDEALPFLPQLWATFELHKTKILGGIAALAVIGLIAGFMVWRSGENAVKSSEALSTVMLAPVTQPNGKPASADSFLKVAAEYPDSSAASRAVLLAAADYFDAGNYTDAKAQFDRFTRDHRDSPFMGQALLGSAACLDAQGKTNEAMTAYKDLIDRHPGETILPQARFALARLYEAQGQPEKAQPLFEDVARNNPYSSIGSEAGMRLEELKVKFPSLTPAVLPTNAVPYKVEKQR